MVKNVEGIKAQIAVSNAYVLYWQTLILSGGYKARKIRKGGLDGPLLTEEELLQDALGVMKNHIERMNDLTDALLSTNDE